VSRRLPTRAIGVSLVALLAIATAGAIATATARAPSPCQRLNGRDLAPARYVRLVERRSGALVGCVLPRGPVRRVAMNGRAGDVENRSYVIRHVVGRFVLVDTSYANDASSATATRVADLRSGRSYLIAQRCAVKAAFACDEASVASVAAAFVTAGGRSVALVVDDGWGASASAVLAFGTDGTSRVLDTGAIDAIAAASLRLTGNVASWTNAGVPRSATLTAG